MNHWLKQWPPFLFGTPRRTLTTLAVLGIILLALEPEAGSKLAENLAVAIVPLARVAILAAALIFGLGFLLKKSGLFPSGNKKK